MLNNFKELLGWIQSIANDKFDNLNAIELDHKTTIEAFSSSVSFRTKEK